MPNSLPDDLLCPGFWRRHAPMLYRSPTLACFTSCFHNSGRAGPKKTKNVNMGFPGGTDLIADIGLDLTPNACQIIHARRSLSMAGRSGRSGWGCGWDGVHVSRQRNKELVSSPLAGRTPERPGPDPSPQRSTCMYVRAPGRTAYSAIPLLYNFTCPLAPPIPPQ